MSPAYVTLLILVVYLTLLWSMNRRGSLISPIGVHAAYLTLYLVVPAVVLYSLRLTHEVGKYQMVVEENALKTLNVAIACMGIGVAVAGAKYKRAKRSGSRLGTVVDDLTGKTQRNRIAWVFAIGAIGTVVFCLTNWEYLGFINSLVALVDPHHYILVQRFKTEIEYGSNYLLQGVQQLFPILSIILLGKWYLSRKPLYRNLTILLVSFDLVFLSLYGAVWIGFSILVLLVLLRQYFQPLKFRHLVFVGFGLFLMVIIAISYKHGLVSVEGSSSGADLFQSIGVSILGSRFSSGPSQLQFVLNNIPTYEPHLYGMSYVHDVIALIPSPIKRSLLPQSYWVDFNGYMYMLMFHEYGGTAEIPLMGEFYANFGTMGVIVGSFLYGFALQRLSNMVTERRFRSLSGAVFGVILGYRLAEATVEGLGERFLVSAVWFVILYFFLSPSREGVAMKYTMPPAQTRVRQEAISPTPEPGPARSLLDGTL